MRRTLPPLASRATRVRLLAWSYQDAAEGGRDGVSSGKPQSKLLSRFEELWRAGSYKELELAMDELRSTGPWQARLFYQSFVAPVSWLDPPAGSSGVLGVVASMMPENVFVPAVIAEAAGYLPSEARVYERRRAFA